MEISKWAIIRQRGKLHFIFFTGVIRWGVTTAFLWTLMMWATNPHFDVQVSLPIALILFPIGGLFWGLWVWSAMEKKFASNHPVPNTPSK